MQTSTKATPKSCSCAQCRRGKGSASAKHGMNRQDRALRAAWRSQRTNPDAVVQVAPAGGYYD